jgi:uncharacterized protein YkvS
LDPSQPESNDSAAAEGKIGQLESQHFFRVGDIVRSVDGRSGTVSESWTHYAVVEWDGGAREEVEQFDESVVVDIRAVD